MPVYSSHLLDYRGLGLEARIRRTRQLKGRSLREVAARAGLSAATLSNIETGKKVPDLRELTKIAAALEAPIVSFVPRSVQYHYLIKRAAQLRQERPVGRRLTGPEPGPARHHNLVRLMADHFVGKQIEPLLVQIQPLADEDLHYISHDHEEFMFVLKGEVESLIGTSDGLVVERLRPGDCMYFCSNLPHCHRAIGEPAETVNVVYSLRGIDADDELTASSHQFYRRGIHRDVVMEVAQKIALLRRSRGLSLGELAQSVGIRARQLASTEAGKTVPDLELLFRLALKFRRPIEYFFAATLDSRPCYFVQRRERIADVPVRERKGSVEGSEPSTPNVFRPLALGFPERGMHPYYVQIKAGDSRRLAPHVHHGQEFIYVLDGEVELITYAGDEEINEVLRPGDSLYLESSVPHMLRGRLSNPYADTSAEVIDVFWIPLGEDYLFREPQEGAPDQASTPEVAQAAGFGRC